MKNGRIQAKDIPDAAVLSAMRRTRITIKTYDVNGQVRHEMKPWRMWMYLEFKTQGAAVYNWLDVYRTYLQGWPLTPPRVFYAKLKSMHRRGLVHGCLSHSYPGCTDRILHDAELCKQVWLHDEYQRVKDGKLMLDEYEVKRAQVEEDAIRVCGWNW